MARRIRFPQFPGGRNVCGTRQKPLRNRGKPRRRKVRAPLPPSGGGKGENRHEFALRTGIAFQIGKSRTGEFPHTRRKRARPLPKGTPESGTRDDSGQTAQSPRKSWTSPQERGQNFPGQVGGKTASSLRAGYFAFAPAGAFFAGVAMRTDEGWAILKDLYSPISWRPTASEAGANTMASARALVSKSRRGILA